MAITWGTAGIYNGYEGRIGIEVSQTHLDGDTERVYMNVYYQSRIKVQDSVNTFQISTTGVYYGYNKDNVSINTPSNSPWSDSNIVFIGTWYIDQPRKKSTYNGVFKAYFDKIEYGGGYGYVEVAYTVPLLENHTVSFEGNGGTNVPNAITKWYGEQITIPDTTPTRIGYTFLGWTSDWSQGVQYYAGQSYWINDESMTLHAVYRINTFTVTFDANGGTTSSPQQTVEYDATLSLFATIPTRKDYLFLGWSTTKNATEPTYAYKEGKVLYVKFYSDTTLYAVWKLDYIKPRVNNLSVVRVDGNGEKSETGTAVKISFDYATDRDGVAYAVYRKLPTEQDSAYTLCDRVTLSEKEGSVSAIVKNTVFSTELTYDIRVNVADNNDFTQLTTKIYSLFIPIDWTENMKGCTFGEPAPEQDGLLRFAFTNIDLAPKNRLLYKGEVMFGQKQLWPTNNTTGSSIMNETHSITLSKKISEMKNGIVLVFGRDGAYGLSAHFVPKQSVVSFDRAGWTFILCTDLFDYIGAKTLYISDTKIEGHANNDATAKNGVSGITYHNEAFYLKYVYEV